MSASTVSVSANPAARRRPVVVAEKKTTNIELVPAEPTPNGANLGDNKGTAAHSKDLSHHSIRGEASRDAVQAKRTSLANNSTVSPRRRKPVAKPEKPRWLTVLSIFIKNLVLMLVIAGLVQMIRKMALRSGDSTVLGTQMGLSEFEGRISEVEGFLKTTAKMMQVQIEVVDKKIDSEVGGLRREMSKKIEDQRASLENALKKLESKSDELSESMSELKNMNWLTKEEFEKMYEELKNLKGDGGENENDVSLDALRAYAREIVQKEIEKHAADGLGRADYALASGGGMVVKHSEPYHIGKVNNWFLSSSRNMVHSNAEKMLKPSFGEPGQCFPLKGSSGFVQIRLRTAIIAEAVTLEHVAKSVAYDRSSAPKDCRVFGWLQGPEDDVAANPEKKFLLTELRYDLEKSNAQTFDVLNSAGVGLVNTVRLDFTTNHGNLLHTCIYRFRVHGHEPDSVSMMTV